MPAPDAADSWSFRSGTDLGSGRTAVRLLGGGDRYEAWLGWDDHLVAPVVIKLLRPSRADRAGSRAAIAREAETLRSVAHPGIVRCFGADLDGERPYLVLEFLDGPRLSTLVRRYGALTHEQLVPLALEMASALGYLHNAGWLHLDVKPQNLIMGAPPRLIDLSIATRTDAVGGLRAVLGTEAYMAPEQCLPERLPTIGPATDVWGLGATLYEAANGWRPFPRRAPDAPYPQLTERPLAFHRRVPPALEALIRACLDPEPASRPVLLEVMDAVEPLMPAARDVALRRLNRRVR
ncbi:MAG: serine/threonine-protein kinase [Chloroflexota bacterium]